MELWLKNVVFLYQKNSNWNVPKNCPYQKAKNQTLPKYQVSTYIEDLYIQICLFVWMNAFLEEGKWYSVISVVVTWPRRGQTLILQLPRIEPGKCPTTISYLIWSVMGIRSCLCHICTHMRRSAFIVISDKIFSQLTRSFFFEIYILCAISELKVSY